jgi:hypothetical protein
MARRHAHRLTTCIRAADNRSTMLTLFLLLQIDLNALNHDISVRGDLNHGQSDHENCNVKPQAGSSLETFKRVLGKEHPDTLTRSLHVVIVDSLS